MQNDGEIFKRPLLSKFASDFDQTRIEMHGIARLFISDNIFL